MGDPRQPTLDDELERLERVEALQRAYAAGRAKGREEVRMRVNKASYQRGYWAGYRAKRQGSKPNGNGGRSRSEEVRV